MSPLTVVLVGALLTKAVALGDFGLALCAGARVLRIGVLGRLGQQLALRDPVSPLVQQLSLKLAGGSLTLPMPFCPMVADLVAPPVLEPAGEP